MGGDKFDAEDAVGVPPSSVSADRRDFISVSRGWGVVVGVVIGGGVLVGGRDVAN